ncbi:hypothetical protein Ancab_019680 [Ancistrocladus abbreviatus]
MMDLKGQSTSMLEDQTRLNNRSTSNQASEPEKSCTDCRTTTTPLWRGGPAGPKTLCNACGIKYHKKRRALLGLAKGRAEKSKKKNSSKSSYNTNNGGGQIGSGMPLKLRFKMLASGGEMMLKKLNGAGKFRGKLGEEEQAAMLLMALSCGSVYV